MIALLLLKKVDYTFLFKKNRIPIHKKNAPFFLSSQRFKVIFKIRNRAFQILR